MTDRELLEFAAKAAGIALHFINDVPKEITEHWSCDPTEGPVEREWDWNPLTDDGDALRLAVTLGLVVDCSRPSAGEPFKQHHVGQVDFQDQQAATRRAIVRAAAAIGKEMP